VVDIGNIDPWFTTIEIGVDGQAHEAALWPGVGGSSRKVLITVHIQDHPAAFVAGVDLPDLIIMRSGDPQGIIGPVDDLPGRGHPCRAGGGIERIDQKGLVVPGDGCLGWDVQRQAQAQKDNQTISN